MTPRQYRALKRAGLCPHCHGRRKAAVGVLCRVCSAKHNEAQNRRYHERKAARVCDWCLGPSDSGVYCKRCSARRAKQPARDSSTARYRAQRKQWRLNAKQRRLNAKQRTA